MLTLLLACSEYELGNADKSAEMDDTGQRPRHGDDTGVDGDSADPTEEVCDGVDNDGDGEIDEGFDENGNGFADCMEEEAYCTPFDNFDGWAYTGDGEWHVESGMLTEGRNGLYAAMAYVADLGTAENFTIQVDTAWGGNANDYTGIAWGIQGESAYVSVWDDPQGYYGRYTPVGGMDVSRCETGNCTQLYADSTADLYWPEGMVWVTWSVSVRGAEVYVTVNGNVVLSATLPELRGSGPGVVGVYSNDNDGGVWFDNFCVWVGD